MIVLSAIAAGIAAASLVISVLMRFLFLDLLFRVEALEANRKALLDTPDRVADRLPEVTR